MEIKPGMIVEPPGTTFKLLVLANHENLDFGNFVRITPVRNEPYMRPNGVFDVIIDEAGHQWYHTPVAGLLHVDQLEEATVLAKLSDKIADVMNQDKNLLRQYMLLYMSGYQT
jgi:hypothetical protein